MAKPLDIEQGFKEVEGLADTAKSLFNFFSDPAAAVQEFVTDTVGSFRSVAPIAAAIYDLFGRSKFSYFDALDRVRSKKAAYFKNLPVTLFIVEPVKKVARLYTFPIAVSLPPNVPSISKGFSVQALPVAPPAV